MTYLILLKLSGLWKNTVYLFLNIFLFFIFIFCVSVSESDEDKNKCFESGMSSFISKPIKISKITSVINEFI